MKSIINFLAMSTLCSLIIFSSCGDDDDPAVSNGTETTEDTNTEDTNIEDTTTDDALDFATLFYGAERVTIVGNFVEINTLDLPDHTSPFYPESDPLYAAYAGDNADFSTVITAGGQTFDPKIAEQNYTLKIPINPAEKSGSKSSTSGGAIGVALNGVIIYNQYNGANELLDDLEFNNTDEYNGHPTPNSGGYHYHKEPMWLTSSDKSALLGYLLDGFPIYGPEDESGNTLATADLDEYHGHTSATAEYPDGIYHYHCTDDAPWINGGEYYGTPGTVTQ